MQQIIDKKAFNQEYFRIGDFYKISFNNCCDKVFMLKDYTVNSLIFLTQDNSCHSSMKINIDDYENFKILKICELRLVVDYLKCNKEKDLLSKRFSKMSEYELTRLEKFIDDFIKE